MTVNESQASANGVMSPKNTEKPKPGDTVDSGERLTVLMVVKLGGGILSIMAVSYVLGNAGNALGIRGGRRSVFYVHVYYLSRQVDFAERGRNQNNEQ